MSRLVSAGWWEGIARAIFAYQEHRTLDLEDAMRAVAVLRSDRFEWGFIGQEIHCHNRATQNGVASERAWIALRNPPLSGVLVVVEDFSIDNGTNTEHTITVSEMGRALPAGQTGSQTSFPRDSRWMPVGVVTTPAAIVHQGSSAVQPAFNIGWSFNPSTGTGGRPLGSSGRLAVLGPDSYFLLTNQGLASSLRAGFLWRELPLLRGIRA